MRSLRLLGIAAAILILFSGCMEDDPLELVTPIEETYEYTTTDRVYVHPAMLTVQRPLEYLSLTVDEGFFYCATTDTKKANEFVNSQRTLLQFLRDSGVNTPKLNYFAMDTDDSFSESDKKRAHIALSHVKSYRQVLITLQTFWGDYTDYGYIHSVANAIAAHLGWQTDTIEEVEQNALDTFFAENPEALNLLYPSFTTTYASKETVTNCKMLSRKLLEQINLNEALTKPIDEQVNDFRVLVDTYAQEISVTFSRHESGYAYYGEYLPLKISTTYVQHFIDRNYDDYCRAFQKECGDDAWNYFSDYRSIFETINIINKEIARSVAHFGLEDEVGVVAMNWLCAESAIELFDKPNHNCYYLGYDDVSFDGTIYLTKISAYLHEYFHHIEHLLNPNLGKCWQSQAFSELGSAQSQYSHHFVKWEFLYEEPLKGLFYDCFGREYQSGLKDYYDAYDFLCYLNSYELDYYAGGAAINSFTRYLLDLYEGDTVPQILLFPETVESVTGKTWEELQADWRQHMEKKFENFEIPDWVYG